MAENLINAKIEGFFKVHSEHRNEDQLASYGETKAGMGQKEALAKLYKEWAGFQWATCGLRSVKKYLRGTAWAKAQRLASVAGWGNSILDAADGLQKERMKDGSSGWATQDHHCC